MSLTKNSSAFSAQMQHTESTTGMYGVWDARRDALTIAANLRGFAAFAALDAEDFKKSWEAGGKYREEAYRLYRIGEEKAAAYLLAAAMIEKEFN